VVRSRAALAAASLVLSTALPAGGQQPAAAARPAAVESDSDCPSAANVEAAVAVLAPPEDGVGLRASVSMAGDSLHIELWRADGSRAGDRMVPAEGGSCDDRARVAAVVIATYERELRGPDLPVAAPAAAISGALPAIAAPPANATAVSRTISATATVTADRELSVALEEQMTLAGGGSTAAALAVTAASDLGARGGRLRPGLVMVGSIPSDRTVDLGQGQGHFRRWSAAAGPRLGVALGGGVRVEPRLLLEASRIDVHGEGYPMSLSSGGTEMACTGGVRLRLLRAHVAPFVAADVRRALTQSAVTVPDLGLSRSLPTWELQLSVGAGLSTAER
jgi:hypothetical protein